MRWYSKPRPKYGDIRVKYKFLLFPKWIDGEWRWFERAAWTETFMREGVPYYLEFCRGSWQATAWLDDKLCKE